MLMNRNDFYRNTSWYIFDAYLIYTVDRRYTIFISNLVFSMFIMYQLVYEKVYVQWYNVLELIIGIKGQNNEKAILA
jgi:hypothetical protein